jgi:hypothetical protein
MKRLITIAAVGLIIFVCIPPVLPSESFGTDENQGGESFREIRIPVRDDGYQNFQSMVIMSKEELDSFLKDTLTQIGTGPRQQFEEALVNANVDFSKEALVLLRHTEASGSVQVTFETPVLRGRTLVCEIRGKPFPPGSGGTTDMAYYCYAVAVSKAHVDLVELQATEGGVSERRIAPIFFQLAEKKCPMIIVTCPNSTEGGNKSIKFKASVTGGKPKSEIIYNWSISKGTIMAGQGTTEIVVDFTDVGFEGLTGTLEVNGFPINCNPHASCTTPVH